MSSLLITRLGCRLLAGPLLALALIATPTMSHARSPAAIRTVTVVAARPALPRVVSAGPLKVRLVATATAPSSIGFVRLKPGASFAQAQKAGGDLFKLRRFVTFMGGEVVPPGRAATVIINADIPGSYAMHISGREGDPGQVLPFAVTPPATKVTAPIRSTVTVALTRSGFAGLPHQLRAGLTTFKVTNRAPGLRNMQMWRLASGKTQRDFITAFSHDRGRGEPRWLHVAGGMDVLSYGQTAWVTLRLAPGTYIADSPLPDGPNGRALVFEGMVTTFTVS